MDFGTVASGLSLEIETIPAFFCSVPKQTLEHGLVIFLAMVQAPCSFHRLLSSVPRSSFSKKTSVMFLCKKRKQ